ncbi:MAG TPA: WGR domain-containing protein, partial [Kofleriaceae bacterium]
GTQFNVGTGFSDAEREDPPDIGAVITFRYQELTKDGVPRFPSWVGVRLDVDVPAPIGKDGKGKAGGAKIVAKEPAPVAKKKPAKPIVQVEEEAEPVEEESAADEEPGDSGRGPVDYFTRLVHDDEKKFWEVSLHGSVYYTHFGKLGSTGQTRVTDVGSKTAARTDVEKRAAQKRKEGYRLDNKKK